MCQIVPFTLPCCKRVYVSVSKLPSCPDEWPKNKCPAELCIQVRAREPERRADGICWRCKAVSSGIMHEQRAYLRPAIDSAFVVHGLEEFDVPGRRNRGPQGGNCWHCGAKGGCQYCEPKLLQPGTTGSKNNNLPRKRVRNGLGPDKSRDANKRIKIHFSGNKDTASSRYPYVYPDLSLGKHSQHPYPESHAISTPGPSTYPYTESGRTTPTHLQQNRTLPPLPQVPPPIPAGWNWGILRDHIDKQTGAVYPQHHDQSDTSLKNETDNKQNLSEPLYTLDPTLESGPVEHQQQVQFEDLITLDDDALETLWKEYNAQQQGHQAESQDQQYESEEHLPGPPIL